MNETALPSFQPRQLRGGGRTESFAMANVARFILYSVLLIGSLSSAALALESGDRLSGEISAEYRGDFDGMKARKAIRVVVPISQTFFFIEKGRLRGLTAELANEFEIWLNKKLKTKRADRITIFMIPTARDEIIDAVAEGRGDVAMANLTITETRSQVVEFTDPVYPGVDELVVTSSAGPDLQRLTDLKGMEIHVRRSSSYFDSLTGLNGRPEFADNPVRIVEVDESLEDEELLDMVNAQMLPAIIVDSHKLEFWRKVFADIKVHDDIAIREGGDIAWAIRKDSPDFRALLNEFVAEVRKGTSIGNTLLRRYQKSDKWLKNIQATEYSERLAKLRAAFERYSERYDIDWRIVAALAFQESKFDHAAKSRTGAVGVMQIKPSTARDPNVGINDISSVEDNIHAGVKYLRFVADSYFDDNNVDDYNRILMALASYNAGPNGIARVRKSLERADVWFGVVELAVAKSIGSEPVNYVSNVHRYYLIMKAIAEKADTSQPAEESKK